MDGIGEARGDYGVRLPTRERIFDMLIGEEERCRKYPGIAFRGPDSARRAWVIGSPLDAWEIVQAWQDLGEDEARTENQLGVSAKQLQLALAYYRAFGEEIRDRAGSGQTVTGRTPIGLSLL